MRQTSLETTLSSTHSNLSNTTPVPVTRLCDNLRQHVLVQQSRPSTPPQPISCPGSPKPSRLAKFGLVQVVEGDTHRFGMKFYVPNLSTRNRMHLSIGACGAGCQPLAAPYMNSNPGLVMETSWSLHWWYKYSALSSRISIIIQWPDPLVGRLAPYLKSL